MTTPILTTMQQQGVYQIAKTHFEKFTVPFTLELVFQPAQTSADKIAALTADILPQIQTYLDWLDQTFSPFLPDSELSRFNRGELTLAETSDGFWTVWQLAETALKDTHGLFNAWHAGVYDPIGLVKGWGIAQCVARFLTPLLANESDLVAVGLNGGGDMQLLTRESVPDWQWQIGIQDPNQPKQVLAHLALQSGAVATSGTVARGEHIAYQTTGRHALSATVVTEDLTTADIWATALVADNFDTLDLGQSVPGTGLLVAANGETRRWFLGQEVV
ncbi:FAD:protein FMN transferase [Leuconostoc lactis]|nr:FAD:protein FMN transferase [Leuconostoc lactis]